MVENEKTKAQIVKDYVNSNIEVFRIKRDNNRRNSFIISLLVAFATFVTTVLLGFNINNDYVPFVKNVALFFSALTTLLGATEAILKFSDLSLRYNQTLMELYSLKDRFTYFMVGKDENDPGIDSYMDELQKILKETNTDWLKISQGKATNTKK